MLHKILRMDSPVKLERDKKSDYERDQGKSTCKKIYLSRFFVASQTNEIQDLH